MNNVVQATDFSYFDSTYWVREECLKWKHWYHNHLFWIEIGVWSMAWWRHQMETFSALLALCAGNSPVKGQWCGALMFPLICAWINGWVNNREAGDLIRHRAHYDVTVMRQAVATHWPDREYQVSVAVYFYLHGLASVGALFITLPSSGLPELVWPRRGFGGRADYNTVAGGCVLALQWNHDVPVPCQNQNDATGFGLIPDCHRLVAANLLGWEGINRASDDLHVALGYIRHTRCTDPAPGLWRWIDMEHSYYRDQGSHNWHGLTNMMAWMMNNSL